MNHENMLNEESDEDDGSVFQTPLLSRKLTNLQLDADTVENYGAILDKRFGDSNERNISEFRDIDYDDDGDKPDCPRGGLLNLEPSVWIILPSITIAFLLISVLLPILPELQLTWFQKCSDTSEPDTGNLIRKCAINYQEAQYWTGILASINGAISFIVSPQIGHLSDIYGRKPFMILASLFTTMPLLVLYLTKAESGIAFYSIIMLGSLLGTGRGEAGGVFGVYVSDCTSAKKRTMALGLMGATAGASMLATPLVSKLREGFEDQLSFFLICGLVGVINTMMVILIIPESLVFKSSSDRNNISKNIYLERGDTNDANATELLDEAAKMNRLINPLEPLYLLWKHETLYWIGLVLLISTLPQAGLSQISLLYLTETYNMPKHEAATFNAWIFAGIGLAAIFSQVVILRVFERHMKLSHASMITISQLFNAIHFVWYAALSFFPPYFYFLILIPIGFVFITPVVINSLVTKLVPKEEYGLALGTISSIRGVCDVFGPLIFSQVYSYLENEEPSRFIPKEVIFHLAGVMALIAMLISATVLTKVEKRTLKFPIAA